MLMAIWKSLKKSRRVAVGPAALVLRWERSTRLRGHDRRGWLPWLRSAPAAPRGAAAPASAPLREAVAAAPARQLALIVGVGPGFGEATARALAEAGFDLALVSRNARRLDSLVAELAVPGGRVQSYACDATLEISVDTMFDRVQAEMGTPHLVVYSIQGYSPGATIDVEVPAFEIAWRHNCLGAFLVARRAARAMVALQRGTIILVGSTSAMLGRANHLNLAVGKFGQRALAQVLAREVGPAGVHVAHLIIDADIREAEPDAHTQAEPQDIAQTVLAVHRQPRSAWTSELDLRPWDERFWEHC